MTVSTRKTFQGAWACSAIVGEQLVTLQYFGYTKREAVSAFRQAVRRETPSERRDRLGI